MGEGVLARGSGLDGEQVTTMTDTKVREAVRREALLEFIGVVVLGNEFALGHGPLRRRRVADAA